MYHLESPQLLAVGAAVVLTVLGAAAPASARHCPAPKESLVWGNCIGRPTGGGPGGQTLEEATAEIRPALDCANLAVERSRSGKRKWCRRYTLRLENTCSSELRFDRPIFVETSDRSLEPGAERRVRGLEGCLPPERPTGPADAGIDADVSDGGELDGGTSLDADGAADTGRPDAITDTRTSDTDDADTHAPDGDSGAGDPVERVCDRFGPLEALRRAGEHTATFQFEHDGSDYELHQTVTTRSFGNWYDETCGEEPASDAGGGDGADVADTERSRPNSCSCRATGGPHPTGTALAVALVGLVALCRRR